MSSVMGKIYYVQQVQSLNVLFFTPLKIVYACMTIMGYMGCLNSSTFFKKTSWMGSLPIISFITRWPEFYRNHIYNRSMYSFGLSHSEILCSREFVQPEPCFISWVKKVHLERMTVIGRVVAKPSLSKSRNGNPDELSHRDYTRSWPKIVIRLSSTHLYNVQCGFRLYNHCDFQVLIPNETKGVASKITQMYTYNKLDWQTELLWKIVDSDYGTIKMFWLCTKHFGTNPLYQP